MRGLMYVRAEVHRGVRSRWKAGRDDWDWGTTRVLYTLLHILQITSLPKTQIPPNPLCHTS